MLVRIVELLKRWQSLAEDAIAVSPEWIFERASLIEETAKALPDQALAQQIADIITPVLMKYDIYLPASQSADQMRDDLAFAVANFVQREVLK